MLALTAVHRGTAFEERSMRILQKTLSMSLRRVGGKSDGGVDLMGWWWLPAPDFDPSEPETLSRRRRLRVLAQCKAEKKKASPNYVRELEGVLHRHISAAREEDQPLVALLVSESPFTKATLLRAQSSPVPFFLLHLPPEPQDADADQHKNAIGTAVWNPALAGTRGLLRGKIEARWERTVSGAGRPGLWWNAYRLPSWTPDNPPLDDEFRVE
ncbi:hypothetical protein C8F01DRAFT_995383 [Mycena amicta]|nr:hypothetical protein C8F01DRAFT_1004288 [Mycena amicta]KAJ7054339.1 hypothetical protein C8F01DRAFT_995383 [Mycena amicta]